MSFPLSRIFNANPEGPNSGWMLHLGYGTDRAKYSDAQHGNHLGRTDLDSASLTYRLNKWVHVCARSQLHRHVTANNHMASGVINRNPVCSRGAILSTGAQLAQRVRASLYLLSERFAR